jgi:GT2 family glycosyltransferase
LKTDILVPTRNGLADSVEMFESLKRTTSDFRLIVIDNASTDGTPEYFESRGVEVIRLSENLGFGAAINRGIERISAPNVVFLNQDTVLTEGWLERLLEYKDKYPGPVGMIGPVSNFAGGAQGVQMTEKDPELQALKLREQFPNGALVQTSFVSFFCCLLDAELIDSVGPLETWFPGGYEDNAYCIEAMDRGWDLLIAADVFIFHKGSRTLQSEFGDSKIVLSHRLDYLLKYKDQIPDPKIVALYRVKNDQRMFQESLKRTSKVVDAIFVWDDNSDPSLKSIVSRFPKVEKYYHSTLPFDEYRDRSALLNWAKASKYDWALALDSDEWLEDAVTYEKLHNLVRVPDPIIRSFVFHENTYWFKDYCRTDGVWNQQAHDRLYRIQLNASLQHGSEKGFHCSTTPVYPTMSRRLTSFRIEHFGYINSKKRAKKYNFYTTQDTDKIPELIGGTGDYAHLLDNGVIQVCKFIPDNHLSLNIMMRNGEEAEVAGILSDLWGFPSEINLLARERSDSIQAIQDVFNANVYVEDIESLPEKRNFLLDQSSQRWALFLDTDEKIEQPFYLRAMMDSFAGAYLFFVKNFQKGGQVSISENVRFFRKELGLRFSGEVHETVEDSLRAHPEVVVRNSPTPILHFGYLKDDAIIDEKMRRYYEKLLEELKRDPANSRVHFSLGLHYFNEGREKEAIGHLERAVALNPDFAEAKKELVQVHVQKGLELLQSFVPKLSNAHPLKQRLTKMEEMLSQMHEPRFKIGSGNEIQDQNRGQSEFISAEEDESAVKEPDE